MSKQRLLTSLACSLAIGAFALVSFAMNANSAPDERVALGPIVGKRPPSNADPYAEKKRDRWQIITVTIQKSLILKSYRRHLTLAFNFDNCEGVPVYRSDPYVRDTSLFQMSVSDSEFSKLYSDLADPVVVVAYFPLKRFRSASALCMQLSGSNVLGQKVRSDTVVVK
jgi:hypothetical protein